MTHLARLNRACGEPEMYGCVVDSDDLVVGLEHLELVIAEPEFEQWANVICLDYFAPPGC